MNDNRFMLPISTILVPVASLQKYVDKMVQDKLREANGHEKQASSERLYAENKRYEKLQRCL